ncbi:helix-turn-helix domain-containing protein|uniref:Helix-turn-helix domain-containing protein n=1 Tax=Leuconostoc lactis TaxID=1246 RepID=A0A6L7ABZ9_LEULA|nr:helix-turn-helix domain-containing protein [Leuconostoc lactis]
MAYFPTFDDLAYATINAVDDNIKTKIESRLAVEPDILTVFINDIADKLFISYQSVSNWERAKSHPTAEMMLTIIETFHLPLNFFMPSDQNSQDLDDEQLILAAFIKSMRAIKATSTGRNGTINRLTTRFFKPVSV